MHIFVKGVLSVIGTNDVDARNKRLIFKNNAPFRLCIWNVYITFINNAKDIDIIKPYV